MTSQKGAQPHVGGQTWHCHVRHRQACSQRANPCMPYRRVLARARALTERLSANALCQHNTCAQRDKSWPPILFLCPQHGVVVMETWRQCIRSMVLGSKVCQTWMKGGGGGGGGGRQLFTGVVISSTGISKKYFKKLRTFPASREQLTMLPNPSACLANF